MQNLLETLKQHSNNVYVFAISCALSASLFYINTYAYLLCGLVVVYLFFQGRTKYVLLALFLVVHVIGTHTFLVVDVNEYKTRIIAKTPSSSLILKTSDNVSIGDVIIGNFQKQEKRKTFFKPSYTVDSFTTFRIPIVSHILKSRLDISDRLFFSSAGKVSIAQALIFADKRYISEHVKDSYTISGLSHLLAMSGMHTGIMIAIVMSVLVFLPLKIRMFFAILSMVLICTMGAFSVTVVRASIFAMVFMGAYFLDIKVNSKRFLMLVFGFIILFSPNSLLDISFLLSFGAVFGIIYFAMGTKNYLYASLLIGIAATLITAPLAMYAFGMTNHLSVLSTVIMTPITYLHILFALIAVVAPIGLDALVAIEQFSNGMVYILSELTYVGFIIKSIPLWLLILTVLFIIMTLCSRYKVLSLLALLVIFYPSPTAPSYLFPNFKGSTKGFIVNVDNKTEIFYQGMIGGLKYDMIPTVAKYGLKNFDYGSIRVFGGENRYVTITSEGVDFHNICLNRTNDSCQVVYMTKSNSLNEGNVLPHVTYVIYKNEYKASNIIELSTRSEPFVIK